MPLKVVLNTLDDAAHARLDVEVFQATKYDPSNNLAASILLNAITSTSKGLLDPKYAHGQKALALLEEYPELMDKLQVAWAANSFKEIRNLGVISI